MKVHSHNSFGAPVPLQHVDKKGASNGDLSSIVGTAANVHHVLLPSLHPKI